MEFKNNYFGFIIINCIFNAIFVLSEKVTYDTTCTLTGAAPANELYLLTNTAISRSFKVLELQ